MKLHYLFSLLLLLSVVACDDDEMMSPIQPDQIQFGGITPTDVNGFPLGNEDPTDWQEQDQWEDRINDLFEFFVGGQGDLCSDVAEYEVFAAYPNPAIRSTILGYMLKDSADLELRILNRDYEVLKGITVSGVFGEDFNELNLNLDELNISNDTVRVYYKIIRPDCELRGHGDIAIQ